MQTHNPAKRIPKSIGTDAKLFGNYTLTDAAVALSPGVGIILLTQVLLPDSLRVGGLSVQAFTLPLAVIAIAIGGLFVYLTPSYTSSLDWIGTFVSFRRAPTNRTHNEAKAFTQIERAYPDRGAIERTDGTLIGFIEVAPPTTALATTTEWQQYAEGFQDFLNTVVEFPIQIYSTTQDFPTEAYLAQYEARLEDADVKANPKLAALIEHYIEWYAAELQERQMTIRDHYIIVSVAPDEISFEHGSLLQQLAALPVLGLFVTAWCAPSLNEQREALFEELAERMRRIESGIRSIDGCGAHRIDVTEAMQLIGAFWAGEPLDYGDMKQVLRTRTLVRGGRR